MPSIQWEDTFSHGTVTDPSPYANVFPSEGDPNAPTIVTSPAVPGQTHSLQIAAVASTNQGVRKNVTGSPTLPWTGFFFRTESHISANAVNIVALHPTGAGNDEMRLEYAADGGGGSIFKQYFTGGTLINSSAYTPGTWVWIETIADFSAGTYNGYWRIDGVDQTGATKVGEAAADCDYIQIISYTNTVTPHTWFAAHWYGGVAASTSDWMGEPAGPTAADDPPHSRLGRGAGW